MLTDPIADFLTRIRNASRAKRHELTVNSSRLIKSIAKVLAAKRFVASVAEMPVPGKNFKELHIMLRTDRESLELKRISKPGQRIYLGHTEIPRVRNGLGVGIFSTSRGVITGEEARKEKVGGEYICEIY